MATLISGVSFAVLRQLAPPFVDGNKNLYFVGLLSSDTSKLVMMKSSNGGTSWSEVGSYNRPDESETIRCIDAFQDGGLIHIVTQTGVNGYLRYSSFYTSDNHWSVADAWYTKLEAITTCSLTNECSGCAIVVRSNGDIIVFYNRNNAASGPAVWYAKHTTSWSVNHEVRSIGTQSWYMHGMALGEDDKVHFVFGSCVPAGNASAVHRSLSSSDVFGGAHTLLGAWSAYQGFSFAGTNPVYYDDDGVERITGITIRETEDAYGWEIDDDGTPGDKDVITTDIEHHDAGNGYAGSWECNLAVDAQEKTVYFVWSNATDRDIYYSKCEDSGGWSSAVELNNGVTVNERGGVVANFYTSGDVVLAYVYNNNGVLYYDEMFVRYAPVNPSVSDLIYVSEADYESGIPNPSASDSITVSEYYRAVPAPLTPSVSDNVSTSEYNNQDHVYPIHVSASDSVSISESPDVLDIPNPDISDNISVTENTELAGGVNPSVSDGVSVNDSPNVGVLLDNINVSDSTSITEYVEEWSHIPIPTIGDENVNVSENIAIVVYNPAISPRYTGIAVKYNVRLKNHVGVATAVFDHFVRLEYEVRVNDVGFFSITFFNDNDIRFSQFILDAQVEIWRSVPGQGVDYYKVFEGFFRKVVKTTAETGERLVTFSGVSYNDLLARTIIAYKAGTIRADKDAPVETVMKEYVEENCGVTADDTVVGRLYQGYLPNFSVEPTAGGGVNWEGSRAFENLLDVLSDIGQQAVIDFDVVGSGPAEFEFKTYVNQIGEDRRNYDIDSRGRNPADNLPVVFSTDFGFASDFSYTYDRMAEGNVVVVLGEGEGSTQTTITRSDVEAVVASPWNRCEVSRPGTSQEYEYQLNQLGDEVLEELKAQQFVEFTPMQQAAQMYGVHYDVGDRVTIKSEDIKTHAKIIVGHITFEQDAEQVGFELSDAPVSV